MRLTNVIEKPIITEKGVHMTGMDRYVFKVSKAASKGAIANAVNDMFGVDVLDVRTMIIPGKKRRIRGAKGFMKTQGWKKAVVRVKSGQKIDMFSSLIGGEGKK